ncbi:MAG TPA: hypothetical protein VHV83_21920, partial [Armatimonadota bacterium]|nr:hypothetical protein [Armatimonadota bacterium]
MRRCLLLALLSVVLSTGVFAAQSRDVVVMMTIEGVSLHQLQSAHSQDFNVLLQHGAIGLMNNKTDGQQTFKDNAVTIGAGTHAIGEEPPLPTGVKVDSGDGFNASEAVDGVSAERQLRWSIDERVPANAVVHTGIGYVQRINSVQKYKIVPGLLGDMLQQHNIGVRVYGNTDHGEVYARNAVAIAMNRRGWVPSGDVGRHTLIPDDSRPFAVHTNYDYLYSAVAHLSAGEHFVVLELGDCGRAETAKTMMPSKRYAQFKRQALLESLQFARKVDDALRASTQHYLLILAVVDQNATDAQRGDLLTPVLLTGSDIRSGYLFSNTTRKPGILTNIDIAPTVLAFFHMPQDVSMLGGPLQVEHGGTIAHLQAENEQMVATYHARFPILVGYVAFVAFGVLLALLLVILRSQAGGGMVTDRQLMSVRPVLIAIMLVPFCATIAGGLGIHAVGPTGIALLGGSLAIATVLHFFVHDTRLISTIVGLATASLLCVDLLFGQPLLRQSVLSYDAITGIRFYGLG